MLLFGRRNIYILLFLILVASCHLTEKSVTGKWVSGSDTLFINSDKSFSLADKKNYYLNKGDLKILDTGFVFSSGNWTLSNRTLYLSFKEDKKLVFGNCSSLWNWSKFFSRYKLIRPAYCYEPSNRFVTFIKIRN